MIRRLLQNKLFVLATFTLLLLFFLGLFAPFFSSSRPLFVIWEGRWYFPLFRFLLFKGFYTKEIDLFFNALILASPLFLLTLFFIKKRKLFLLSGLTSILLSLSLYLVATLGWVKDPAYNPTLATAKEQALLAQKASDSLLGEMSLPASFEFVLAYSSDYDKLNRLLLYRRNILQENRLKNYLMSYESATKKIPPTLFSLDRARRDEEKRKYLEEIRERKDAYNEATKEFPLLFSSYKLAIAELTWTKIEFNEKEILGKNSDKSELIRLEKRSQENLDRLNSLFDTIHRQKEKMVLLHNLEERERWLENESKKLFVIDPLFRSFHWEEDAGGGELFNRYIPLTDVTRPNRKDLMASLFFGIRISLVVGLGATLLALAIGLPLGLISGYFGGTIDLLLFRFIEIWEALPSFFMLLLITAVVQSKSIFLIILLLGLFGWTHFARFIRAETLRQRSLPYVMASKSLGFSSTRLIFSEILPNAIPPVLALLPFSMMSAMTAEAALAFLGLGEENSTSFGVLMSEARSFFPGESYLLWPPALILTVLLIAFALIGDTLRDALDPKESV